MQYDAQLQLMAYKPALIWLNHSLITGKWSRFNGASTLQTLVVSAGVKLHFLTHAQHCTVLTLTHDAHITTSAAFHRHHPSWYTYVSFILTRI